MNKVLVCTSNCGYGDGVFHPEDTVYIHGRKNLVIKRFHMLNFPFCHEEDKETLLNSIKNFDLIIFPFHSSAMMQFFERMNSTELKKFRRSNATKVIWTLDNHLFPEEDIKSCEYIDLIYVSHPNYTDHLHGKNMRILPSAYYLTNVNKYIEMLQSPCIKKVDLLINFRYFKHHNHENSRISTIYKILLKLQDRCGINILCGSIPTGKNYINAIRSSRIVVNVSMLGDFNIRNFEAIAFGKILLADRTSAHEYMEKNYKIDYSKTFLFHRDCTDFEEMLSKALSCKKEVGTTQSILNNNMLIHRYVSIVNDVFSTDYKVHIPTPLVGQGALNSLSFYVEKNYSLQEIGIRHAYNLLLNKKTEEAQAVLGQLTSR